VKLRRLAVPSCFPGLLLPRQRLDPVQWSLAIDPTSAPSGSKVLAKVTAASTRWHLYSLSTPDGPIPTTLRLAESPGAEYRVYQPRPVVTFDPNFNLDTETFEKEVVFLIEVAVRPMHQRDPWSWRTGSLPGLRCQAMSPAGAEDRNRHACD